MRSIVRFWLVVFSFLHVATPAALHAAENDNEAAAPRLTIVGEQLKESLDRLQRSAGSISPARSVIVGQMQRFYDSLEYRIAWTNRKAIARLIEVIRQSADDGLDPSDYHLEEIRAAYDNPPTSPALQVRADLLMTDGLFTLLSHMRAGKVVPKSLDSNWNLPLSGPAKNSDDMLKSAVMDAKFPEMIASLRPSTPEYRLLRKGLAKYRKVAAAGGWKPVPAGPRIGDVGQIDERMPLIRKRLVVTGDLIEDGLTISAPANSADSTAARQAFVYTAELFDAVKAFQERHGLEVDGIIGTETAGAMAVPVEEWIDQIRINLERYRWYSSSLGSTYVMVNIPSFSVEFVRDDSVRWKSRVIVGKPNLQTPVFKAEIQSVIFNPRWVIPSGILAKEALPAIKKNLDYLSRHQLTVVNNQGKPVDPSSVNWAAYQGRGFPYRLVQASGDDGALGRIKFNMPNRFTVYMHDTPTKPLFERSYRAFSHGCVRVQNPNELGVLLFNDPVKWDMNRIEAMIDTGKTRTINLPERIPVYFMYQTAFPDGDNIDFRYDVYDRDPDLQKALDSTRERVIVEEALRPVMSSVVTKP
ncbi:Peptidoglycan-binding domain 1 protein [Chlorobaculum parvum NCIB 8327]|uniref:Peptidoglycan-binding domain 1 protein n=1 Tax=Chlorobaculum parvum (strain DSM 263 / NCIMB 8327) TaxID=517417 RepID=B3QKX9_CHLP8|nr:L,D-transpeptidase family protein [Chlorobaculum parvum]ACF10767.1 Peptidoglycan-binding domain 1 protein [Chlorobaculum parvum NCIB 8327]